MTTDDVLASTNIGKFRVGVNHTFRRLGLDEYEQYFHLRKFKLDLHESIELYVLATARPTKERAVITFLAENSKLKSVKFFAAKLSGAIRINIFGDSLFGYVGNIGYNFDALIELYSNSNFLISDDCTSNGVHIIACNSDVVFERDCMLSSEIIIQSSDQHGILDLSSMRVMNGGRRQVVCAEHVWLGRRSMLLPRARLSPGTIVGAGSVVANEIPPFSIAGGVPARILANGRSWTRSPGGPSKSETEFFERTKTLRGSEHSNIPVI